MNRLFAEGWNKCKEREAPMRRGALRTFNGKCIHHRLRVTRWYQICLSKKPQCRDNARMAP